jgi:Domain of unknown function (DUF4178)
MTSAPLVRALTCPSCGGAIESHLGAWSTTVVCARCGSTLDARSDPLQILIAADQAAMRTPSIPLGSRGVFEGDAYEAVGWQERQIVVDAEVYRWREFVLFNPYLGFRYLSEYDGHWNFIRPIEGTLPTAETDGVSYAGSTFRHFQNAGATTIRVLGEFPWEVRRDDVVSTSDYVAPPVMLSSEDEDDGTTWSIGAYLEPDEIVTAFDGVALELPPRHGVFANQPSPWASLSRRLWMMGLEAGVVLLLLCGALLFMRQNTQVFRSTYQFVHPTNAPAGDEQAFVTPLFALTGRGNVRLSLRATVDNAWLGAGVTLIDADRGTAFDTGLEVGRYSGVDAGESWSEGSYDATFRIPAVPAGNYYLRIAPEGAASAEYTVSVKRDTPVAWYLLPAILALLVPPLMASIASGSFEHRRWMESDHPPVSSSDEDDDDE